MTRWVLVSMVSAATLVAGCTMKSQDAPSLTGPSEQGTSIVVTVTPDVIAQDGSSQSLVTIQARDSNGKPLRNLSLRSEIVVNGVRADFGSLSARNLVTDANGRATLVYTAPAAPAGPAVDSGTIVDIAVTPLGTDFGNSLARLASIRLVPTGIVVPPDGLQPAFTVTPGTPVDHQNVFFDATTSSAPSNNPIVSYTWDFGDGATGSGATTTHSYETPATYFVKLTIADALGRTAQSTQAVTVVQGALPTAGYTYSPNPSKLNQPIHFNASASQPAPGHRIVSYNWDFGDGSQQTTANPLIDKIYTLQRSYVVTLTVTDETGKTSLPVNQTVTPLP